MICRKRIPDLLLGAIFISVASFPLAGCEIDADISSGAGGSNVVSGSPTDPAIVLPCGGNCESTPAPVPTPEPTPTPTPSAARASEK